MRKLFYFPFLFFAALSASLYVILILVLFMARSIAILFILPYEIGSGTGKFDHSPNGEGKERTFLQQVKAIYKVEMRVDPVWIALYDHFNPPKFGS